MNGQVDDGMVIVSNQMTKNHSEVTSQQFECKHIVKHQNY